MCIRNTKRVFGRRDALISPKRLCGSGGGGLVERCPPPTAVRQKRRVADPRCYKHYPVTIGNPHGYHFPAVRDPHCYPPGSPRLPTLFVFPTVTSVYSPPLPPFPTVTFIFSPQLPFFPRITFSEKTKIISPELPKINPHNYLFSPQLPWVTLGDTLGRILESARSRLEKAGCNPDQELCSYEHRY